MAPETSTETLPFQAEVNQLLDLVIHSLYSNKEIFLRELISNASDALDKLRFLSVTQPQLLEGQPSLQIRLIPDETQKTLTVEDTGIGMKREQLVKELGTIAHSGSRAFLAQLKEKGEAANPLSLIGQFGVGFYSAYLVANRVEVVSRAAGASEAWRWSSDAQGSFTVQPEAGSTERGTRVILHLKPEHTELLSDLRLRELVRQYSDYLSHPIKLKGETINRASALWQRPKSEITEEQYTEFYQHLTHDFEPPAAHTHFTAEGAQQFTGLLFLPKRPPFDFEVNERKGLRLFVRRVFILDNVEELLPRWLRFFRGVVDSDDLPLNVSRELLQDSSLVRTIKKQLAKKSLDLLERLAKEKPEDYASFWESFGPVLKEGLLESEYRERLAALARFQTSAKDGLTSLADYVSRMPEAQPSIYFALGESREALAGSPYLEALQKKGFEVLLLTDPVDTVAAPALGEFAGKKLVSAMQADLPLPSSGEEAKEAEAKASSIKPLLAKVKEVLKDRISDARATDRLTESPCCLVVPQGATPAYLERLLRERGRAVAASRRILELNPNHPAVERLQALHQETPDSKEVTEAIEVLYDCALLAEGSAPTNANQFTKRVAALLARPLAGGTPGTIDQRG
jgi:molecular chaperone HtpG